MTDRPFLRIAGVVCPCDDDRLRVIVPGSDGEVRGTIVLRRPVADRGWCCTDHARESGLPFLPSERAA